MNRSEPFLDHIVKDKFVENVAFFTRFGPQCDGFGAAFDISDEEIRVIDLPDEHLSGNKLFIAESVDGVFLVGERNGYLCDDISNKITNLARRSVLANPSQFSKHRLRDILDAFRVLRKFSANKLFAELLRVDVRLHVHEGSRRMYKLGHDSRVKLVDCPRRAKCSPYVGLCHGVDILKQRAGGFNSRV